jgi:hypothetical protein
MATALDKRTQKVADLVVDQFIRLGVDTDTDPCSGLMTRIPNVVTEIALIEIYDDYESGFYDGEAVLSHLATLSPDAVSLGSESPNNIWQHLSAFQA